MSSESVSWEVEYYLGEYDLYPNCDHYPLYLQPESYNPNQIIYNVELVNDRFNLCTPIQVNSQFGGNVTSNQSEVTYFYIYIMTDYINSERANYPPATGSEVYKLPFIKSLVRPSSTRQLPDIDIPGTRNYYRFSSVGAYISKRKYYEKVYEQYSSPDIEKPNYKHLVTGYGLDLRTIPALPKVTSTINQNIKIAYYKCNPYEAIPGLVSIDWMSYDIELIAGKATTLPIYDCVLGTLYCDNASISLEISNLPTEQNKYPFRYLLQGNLPSLFSEWNVLRNTAIAALPPLSLPPMNATNIEYAVASEVARHLRVIGANNNYWHNKPIPTVDRLPPYPHPMFTIDNQRAYDWHIKRQVDGSKGDLIMDSPRTIEIHTALNAGKYAVNELDPTKPRVANLGWYINRQSEVLGIRVKADGTIDETLEKTVNRRKHVNGSEQNDPQEYGINSFGSKGMMVRHLPNKFSPNGTVAGGYRKVKDLPQLLAEFHEQANAAVGYQEGTAIEIQLDGQTYRYPNQLALLTELFVTAKQTATYSKGAFFSSIVGEQSIKEVIAGLGLRTVDKYLEFNVAGKTAKLYYKGISASQSVRRKLSAITTNIGIAIGNII